MGSVDGMDDRTFSVNLSGDGALSLRDKVSTKLQEFMGDYTDDALVEYVIVLLKNGRRKEEAKNELNVFLGDDSDSFVSWLWDHLATNVHLYVRSEEPCAKEVIKAKPSSVEKMERNNSSQKLESESDQGKTKWESKSRHNRAWKGLARDASDPPPLRSSEMENVHVDERSRHRARHTRRSPSPQPADKKKRSRTDERWESKRETNQVNTGGTRRLLQFAVRDAVSMSRPSNATSEPSLKRLRSVVSTPNGDSSLVERPRPIKSIARVPNAMAAMIKAVAEAAEDTARVKPSGNVFDRLSRGAESAAYEEVTVEDDGQYGVVKLSHRLNQTTYLQRRGCSGQYAGDMTMLENETDFASDYSPEIEEYDDVNAVHHSGAGVSLTGTSWNKDGNSMMVDYSVDKKADGSTRLMRNKDQDQPAVAAATSQKIVNISVNVNTWKPPHYQEPSVGSKMDGLKSVQEGQRSDVLISRNNNSRVVVNGNTKPDAYLQKEPQKSVLPATGSVAGRPLEDPVSRSLFVSNVHFAATKDSLTRHFNKFGDVVRVIIIMDTATGQPTGSAYVEFVRKEAADNALSLDGTSFMSRLLKVVRRSASQQEMVNSSMAWPRAIRGASPFSTARFPRASFPRVMTGSFRGRAMTKPNSRSFQWKRDAQPSAAETVPSPTMARSLTYVRTEANPSTT